MKSCIAVLPYAVWGSSTTEKLICCTCTGMWGVGVGRVRVKLFCSASIDKIGAIKSHGMIATKPVILQVVVSR